MQRGRVVSFLRYSSLREPKREDRRDSRGRRNMKADIDFDNGTITLICSKCRRKYPRRIAEIGSGVRIKCKCNSVVSWQGDLSWVTYYANPYHWDATTPLLPTKGLKVSSLKRRGTDRDVTNKAASRNVKDPPDQRYQ
jgi:hypothetical protein